MKINTDRAARAMFVLSLVMLIFAYGIAVGRYHLFPYKYIQDAYDAAKALPQRISLEVLPWVDVLPWYYRKVDNATEEVFYTDNAYPGLNLVVSTAENGLLSVRVIDMAGKNIHEWVIDWFEIWPEPDHIPADDPHLPKSRPGTNIHGIVLMENGDLVFNFEYLGLVRLDACGNVIWRLPYRTHHSVHLDDHGNIWVSGQKRHLGYLPNIPNYFPPFLEPMILEVSPEGKILYELSVVELLQQNDLNGLLYMGASGNWSTKKSGDALHLNDVEIFPESLKEGVFAGGDILISLRNINTVLVFNRADNKVKFLSVGRFVRQHDPDFIDGNTISIFDNNNVAPESEGHQSRILILSAKDNRSEVYYSGSKNQRFYTDILGKHQWLPNGNLLISEPINGRAFEIDEKGRIVWEFFNVLEKKYVSQTEEVQRIPMEFIEIFNDKRLQCARP